MLCVVKERERQKEEQGKVESCEAHESRPFVKGLVLQFTSFVAWIQAHSFFLFYHFCFCREAIRDSDAVVCAMHSGKVM